VVWIHRSDVIGADLHFPIFSPSNSINFGRNLKILVQFSSLFFVAGRTVHRGQKQIDPDWVRSACPRGPHFPALANQQRLGRSLRRPRCLAHLSYHQATTAASRYTRRAAPHSSSLRRAPSPTGSNPNWPTSSPPRADPLRSRQRSVRSSPSLAPPRSCTARAHQAKPPAPAILANRHRATPTPSSRHHQATPTPRHRAAPPAPLPQLPAQHHLAD
jgi:hypothetical protein